MPDPSSPAKKPKALPAKKIATSKSSFVKGAPPGPKDIEIIPGEDTRILLVAPHGVMGDDDHTDIIARDVQERLKCRAIINAVYRKPDKKTDEKPNAKAKILDVYKVKQARRVPGYFEAIKNAVDEYQGRTLVVWLHGMADESADDEQAELVKAGKMSPGDGTLSALIGFGQGPRPDIEKMKRPKKVDKESLPTAEEDTASRLRDELTNQGLLTLYAPESSNFRGRDPNRLNQWILKQVSAPGQVESLQIEIRQKGFRDGIETAKTTGRKIAEALRKLVPPLPKDNEKATDTKIELVPDNEMTPFDTPPADAKGADISAPAQNSPPPAKEAILSLDKRALNAVADLKKIVHDYYHGAMVTAGKYIIKEFYGDSIEKAQKNEPEHLNSLSELYRLIRHQSGDGPSRTWLYDSVNLVVDEHFLKGVRTYGRLGHSHKVLLTHVSDWDTKTQLVEQAVKNNLTVARLREEIKKTKPRSTIYVSVDSVPADETLANLGTKRLKTLRGELIWHIADKKKKLKQHEEDRTRVEKAIEAKPKNKRAERNIGFRDWTEPACNVNIQTGCSNNCLYCYAKTLAYQREQKALGTWADQMIRRQDVDKPRNLYHGLVGFPSTHDITPKNVADYIYVLGKLLRAGNEVLIVSKPRLECIRQICEASLFFKDKILFRFTIGSMNNKILKLWEPGAPEYQDRKEALKYAFDQGFRTSISIEPMLDSDNVGAMVDDLMPFITEDVWIGKMNHIDDFAKDPTDEMKEEVKRIKAGQTDERLAELHEDFKGNKRVKWKTGSRPEDLEKPEEGWPEVQIKNDAGAEISAVAPLIVSASRRNDIPALHSRWFMAGIKRGHLGVTLPKRGYFSFQNTRFITFWTKNPAPMLQHLDELDKRGIYYYFTYTLNDYEKEGLEPNLPALEKRIATFQELSERIGKERVVWRFDPLVLSDVITKKVLVEKIVGLFPLLSPYTERLVISFLKADEKASVVKKLANAGIKYQDFSQDDISYVAQALGALGKKHGVQVATCAEASDLSFYGIEKNRCIDGALFRRISNDDPELMKFLGDGIGPKDKNQRSLCGCLPGFDVGTRSTCAYLCHYCYANVSEKAVEANLERLTGDGEFLIYGGKK